jgi:Leucine-rich repeat (LRR) protein
LLMLGLAGVLYTTNPSESKMVKDFRTSLTPMMQDALEPATVAYHDYILFSAITVVYKNDRHDTIYFSAPTVYDKVVAIVAFGRSFVFSRWSDKSGALCTKRELTLGDADVTLSQIDGATQLRKLCLGLDCRSITDAALEHLEGLTNLEELDLSGTNVTDAGLQHIKGLRSLKQVICGKDYVGAGSRSCDATDAGLACLKDLTQLRRLDLVAMKITDAGLEHLKGLTQLQELNLSSTQITDAGLADLKTLTQLQKLDLSCTQATDAGLVYLEGLTQLQELNLWGTKVTAEGVKKLQKALPNCKISKS